MQQALFRAPLLRTTRAPFDARSSPVTYATFVTVVEDIQHRCGVLHYAYLQVGVSGHLCPFALWTVFPSSLEGRCSFDYYGHSVAIELAFLSKSSQFL